MPPPHFRRGECFSGRTAICTVSDESNC
jgi:hypothetical protein